MQPFWPKKLPNINHSPLKYLSMRELDVVWFEDIQRKNTGDNFPLIIFTQIFQKLIKNENRRTP